MKVLVSELTSRALDWAVAKCEGLPVAIDPLGHSDPYCQGAYIVLSNDHTPNRATHYLIGRDYSPSTDWALGGPIIEREFIGIDTLAAGLSATTDGVNTGDTWVAMRDAVDGGDMHRFSAPAALIAAMRCFVASRMGDEIDVPDCQFVELTCKESIRLSKHDVWLLRARAKA